MISNVAIVGFRPWLLLLSNLIYNHLEYRRRVYSKHSMAIHIVSKNASGIVLLLLKGLLLLQFNYCSGYVWRLKRQALSPNRFSMEEKIELIPYNGPKVPMEYMEAGIYVEDICLNVMVGPSIAAEGRGLFISLGDDGKEVTLPAGQIICGYSKGSFQREADGDKTVGYSFNDVQNGVIFEKKLMPLFDAIMLAKNMTRVTSVDTIVYGHVLSSDAAGDVRIERAPDFFESYFVPNEVTEFLPINLGVFANDFAFSFDMTANEYTAISSNENILQLVWRLALTENGMLMPTWPVVILMSDTQFTNHEPMEVGLRYSWKYWQAVLEAQEYGDDDA